MRWCVVVLCLASMAAMAQDPKESSLGGELRREGERVSESCNFSFKAIPMCGYTLFTDHPLHIAAGSMPPQNGFGVGGAFVWTKNTTNWRLSWDVDAVTATSGGAWRAGGYMKMVHNPHPKQPPIEPLIPTPGATPPPSSPKGQAPFTHPYALFNLYVQSISLNKLNYFGEGNNTTLADASLFGMTQTIVGASAIKPLYEWAAIRKLNLALTGEINGRFVSIRGERSSTVPSIEAVYTDATAPGLSSQPAFVQMSQGIRIKPATGDYLKLNYAGTFQEFFAPSSSTNSFLRWAVDLNHTINLYRSQTVTTAGDRLGPDSCDHVNERCPKYATTRNLNGFIGARLLISESITSATSFVPFYFQQTLGGQDINSQLSLGSYQDYRFRAPNILLLQGYVEHSVWGPFGLKFMADEGRVASTRGDLGFSHLRHSFAAGLTLRAGAFPMVSLMFAWGGSEGHHNIFNMNSSLLGGASRPLLD